ncbi:acyltransferase family protein [Terrabacter sp. GCM10028922]|uniref:acyltransferase family protein n=1 Tax=Terrabacter sp. GCM10028922 TaxID=3273428 RepID=UPI00361D6996
MVDARPAGQLHALTSMRFVAAFVVLLHHLPLAMPGLVGLLSLAQAGYVGVTFFFVLSGFVLTWGWTSTSRVSDFYIKRAARVYPLHVLTAFAMALLLGRAGVDWTALPANLVLLQAWSPDPAVYLSFVGAAWSLSCEVFFYVCFPLLVSLLSRCRHVIRWAVAIVAATIAGGTLVSMVWPSSAEYLYHLPMFRLADFTVGILVCLAIRRGWRLVIGPAAAAALVATVYLCVLLAQTSTGSGIERSWFYSVLMVLPFGLLIASLAGRELSGGVPLLRAKGLVLLGQWSFALYLVHGVVLAALQEHVRELRGAPAVIVGMAVVALVVTSSWLVHTLYERPIEAAVRRRWTRRRVAGVAEAATIVRTGTASSLTSPRQTQ